MDQEQPHPAPQAVPHGAHRDEPQPGDAGAFRAIADRICRWVADERDEIDRVAVRTWN